VSVETLRNLINVRRIAIAIELRRDLWHQKTTGVPGLLCVTVIMIRVHLAVLVKHRLVIDGRTDRRKDTWPWHSMHCSTLA